jgi:hypothetical protein
MSSSTLPPRKQIAVIKQQDLKKAFKGIRPRRLAMMLNPRFRTEESRMRIAMGQYGREENARLLAERKKEREAE